MRLLATALFAIGFSSPVQAQSWDCTDPGNLPQQGMNYCAHQDYREADRKLNVAYKEVRGYLQGLTTDFPRRDGKTEAIGLRDAQRAWIKYRDLACENAGLPVRGGSLEPLLYSACLADLTERRTQDLYLLIEREPGEQ